MYVLFYGLNVTLVSNDSVQSTNKSSGSSTF